MIKYTADKAAVVDTDLHWIDIKDQPPKVGAKILCINRLQGIAVLTHYTEGYGFTHWHPLPTFKELKDGASSQP